MNEEYLLVVGKRIGNSFIGHGLFPKSGSPSRVAFSYDEVVKREDKYGDVIGFFHTHPSFYSNPSSIDDRTMDGWVNCLGRPLLCAIKGINGTHFYWYLPSAENIECRLNSYMIVMNGLKLGNGFIGKCPNIQILK